MVLAVESRNGGKKLPHVDLVDNESTWGGQESNIGLCN